jgi:probable F420-dependent oxidoreductase
MAKIGIMIEGQEGLTWDRWRNICRDVDALGFDSLRRSDHSFSVMGEVDRDCIECWASLALAAEWTKTIEFGPMVSPMTFHQPSVLARSAASVDALSGGRLILGVGAGWYEKDYRVYGYEYGTLRSRMDLFAEGVRRIEHRLENLTPKPLRRIPILIGGAGERRTLPLVGRHAHIWHAGLDLDTFRRKNDLVKQHAAAAGRDHGAIERATSWTTAAKAGDLLAEGVTLHVTEIKPAGAGYDFATLLEMRAWRDSVR